MTNPFEEQTNVDEMSLIRQAHTPHGVTVSNQAATGNSGEEIMLAGSTTDHTRRYLAPMTSANSVIAAIEARRPGLSEAKTHLLLFFCQGHHLADTGGPLYADPLYATPTGTHVDLDPTAETSPMTNRPLGTVGYVLRRYADMRDPDLLSLVQISSAWQLAMRSGDDGRIEWVWLTDWFRRPAELAGKPTAEDAAEVAAFRKARAGG